MLALLILPSQQQTPGRPSFRLLISTAPPLHPQCLIPPHRCSVLLSCDVHKAWSLSDTCARVRPTNALIRHHNLSLRSAVVASVVVTLARKTFVLGSSLLFQIYSVLSDTSVSYRGIRRHADPRQGGSQGPCSVHREADLIIPEGTERFSITSCRSIILVLYSY